MNLTARQLKKLLSYLDIDLCNEPVPNNNFKIWKMRILSLGVEVGLKSDLSSTVARCAWLTTASLQEDLFLKSRYFICSSTLQFSNPYFGCKTFEDALVAKDLNSNGN